MGYTEYNTAVVADAPLIRHTFETNYGDTGSLAGSVTTNSPSRNAAYAAAQSNVGIYLDGIGYVTNNNTTDFFGDKEFSVEAWFKTDTAGSYKTIVRKSSGSSHFILRVRGNVGLNDGKLEVYFSTDSWNTSIVSPNRVDDNAWHHAVITASGGGTPIRMYIDGTLVTSSANIGAGIHSTPVATWIGRDYTGGNAAENFIGSLDEVAIYGQALTAARVTAHYNASITSTNAGYTAQPMLVNAAMANAAVSISTGYTAQAMTASATAPDATVFGNTHFGSVLVDARRNRSLAVMDSGQATTLTMGYTGGSFYDGVYKVTSPVVPSGYTVVNAKLRIYVSSVSYVGSPLVIYRVDQDWTATGTAPALTASHTQSIANISSPGWHVFDIANIANQWAEGTPNYGIAIGALEGGSGGNITAMTLESSNKPTIEYVIGTAASINVPALPATASAAMPDPVISTSSDISASGLPMTASAAMIDPVVSVTGHRELIAEPMTASAEMPVGSGFSVPGGYTAEVMLASADIVDATSGTTSNAEITTAAATARISLVKPAAVNGEPIAVLESEDDYFNRVMSLTPESWWRLNDKGSVVDDRMDKYDGVFNGVLMGQFAGPGGRHSVHFDGVDDYISQDETSPEISTGAHTIEFTFRTTKQNQFVMFQKDQAGSSLNTEGSGRYITMRDGKLVLTAENWNAAPTVMTGFKNYADGEWHHVVISDFIKGTDGGSEIHVDGKLEIRRYAQPGFYGHPDFVGGAPGISGADFFEGDMTEIVVYAHDIAVDDIIANYYAVMGWTPIKVNSMVATATMVDARAKGNQKKALYLYWDNKFPEYYKDLDGSWPQFGPDDISFDPMEGFVGGIEDYHGFKVFPKSVINATAGTAYRDPVTDEPSLINLETDVDLDDYDVIMFKDWPDESAPHNANQIELDFVELNFPGQKERLVQQLRDANDRGIGLFVTNPRLAVDLGIVDRVEFVPTLHESKYGNGNAEGFYDYGAAVEFPWNISGDDGLSAGNFAIGTGEPQDMDPAFLSGKAYFYNDTHDNNRFRVRALVEGLTDIPSYMIEDAVFHADYALWGWQGVAYKYLHRMNGLQIGDEFIYNGSEIISRKFQEMFEYAGERYFGTFATPMANVKAGTIVTTFGATHWLDKQKVENPYKDYATTIVLDRGDMLAGRPVGGRIFVNFSEKASRGLAVPVQVLPDSEHDVNNDVEYPYLYPEETNAQKEWEFSWTRTSLTSSTPIRTGALIEVTMPDGGTITVGPGGTTPGQTLVMTRSGQLFPITYKPKFNMADRGMYWLSSAPVITDSDTVVRAKPMTVTATAPDAQVVSERDTSVEVEPMVALAVMRKVAEDVSGDVEINTLPLTASATITGFSKRFYAEPMTATATLVENFDMVHASGEQVVLTLHGYDATLFIKEEA